FADERRKPSAAGEGFDPLVDLTKQTLVLCGALALRINGTDVRHLFQLLRVTKIRAKPGKRPRAPPEAASRLRGGTRGDRLGSTTVTEREPQREDRSDQSALEVRGEPRERE